MFDKLIENFKNDKVLYINKLIVYISLIFVNVLDISIIFKYNPSIEVIFIAIILIFFNTYLSILLLCIKGLKNKISKTIYLSICGLSFVLFILVIIRRLEYFAFILFISIIIVITLIIINKNIDAKEIFHKFKFLYLDFILSIGILILKDNLFISKLLFFINVILMFIYFDIKLIIYNFICKIIDKSEKHYYNKHPEVLKKEQEMAKARAEYYKETQKYLDSIPNYAIIPNFLYNYDNIHREVEENNYHDKKVTFDLCYDNASLFSNVCEYKYYEFTRKENKKLYIDNLLEVSEDHLHQICSKEMVCFKKDKVTITIYLAHNNMPNIDTIMYKQKESFSDNCVSGYISFYYNVQNQNIFDEDKNKVCLKDNYMIISNIDGTKFYIAFLTEEKPEKTEDYIKIMKVLNPNLEKYIDTFGNEIDFREKF